MFPLVKQIIKVSCIVVTLILAITLGVLLYRVYQEEQQSIEHHEQLEQLTLEYRVELNRLRAELNSLSQDLAYTAPKASYMVGYIVSNVSDMGYIRNQIKQYSIDPIIILDCSMNMTDINALIDAADPNWEIMLYTSLFTQDTMNQVKSIRAYLESVERRDTELFFIRNDNASPSSFDIILQNGFVGYTTFHDSPTAGQNKDGSVYFDYLYPKSNSSDFPTYISTSTASKATILLVWDMSYIRSKQIADDFVVDILDRVHDNALLDIADFISAAQAKKQLSEINQIIADKQASHDEKSAALSKRIAELEQLIEDIYRQSVTEFE